MSILTITVLVQFLAILAIGWLIGDRIDQEVPALIVVSLLFVFWIVWQHRRFESWLDHSNGETRMGYGGLWTYISDIVGKRIRQMKMEQQQLQEDVEFFKDSFQAISSAVVIIDSSGRIGWCNMRAESLLGIHPDRDSQQMLVSLFRAPAFIEYLEKKAFEKSLQVPSPIDGSITLEVQATTYRRDNILIFARDVSDVAQLERMRRDFIANVSHEMRTPLTVITGYLDMLKMSADTLPAIWTETMDKMLAQSQRMDNMVNDLIWLSRLESVPASRDHVVVNVIQMLNAIVADARVSAPNKTIHFTFSSKEYEEGRSVGGIEKGGSVQFGVHGAFEELRSAFTNLIQNAVKYTDDDGEIIVRCFRKDGELKVIVQDNGIGIDSVHIPRLTERFYRADASRTSATGGTGLGLAIVKHVLVRHDGRLEISSKLGEGSVFTSVFPASRVEEINDQSGPEQKRLSTA